MRMSAQFKLGERTLTVKRPTDAQMMVLLMSRKPTDGDVATATRLVEKVFRILENVVGADVYYDVIEAGLINSEFTHTQVLELVSGVITYDWDAPAVTEETARAARYERISDVQLPDVQLPGDLSPEERAMIERMRSGGQSQ